MLNILINNVKTQNSITASTIRSTSSSLVSCKCFHQFPYFSLHTENVSKSFALSISSFSLYSLWLWNSFSTSNFSLQHFAFMPSAMRKILANSRRRQQLFSLSRDYLSNENFQASKQAHTYIYTKYHRRKVDNVNVLPS